MKEHVGPEDAAWGRLPSTLTRAPALSIPFVNSLQRYQQLTG